MGAASSPRYGATSRCFSKPFAGRAPFRLSTQSSSPPEALEALGAALADDPRLEVDIRRKSDYYAEQSRPLTTLITTAGVFSAVLMGAGAMFAAVGTMYTSVVSRTRAIATLRAIGFVGTAVVCFVLAEAMVLAIAGGAVGALAAWVLFDGYAVSTLNFQSMSQVAFAFAVTPSLVAEGMASAILIALLGALWPAWRAVTLPVVGGLREP